MEIASDRIFQNFEKSLEEFKESIELTKQEKAAKLASQVDILSQSRNGLVYLLQKIGELDRAGIFNNTVWSEPDKLIPLLVKGTLKVGHPTSSFEILSELRLLAFATGIEKSDKIAQKDAQSFLEEVMVHNLEFAHQDVSEETRLAMPVRELKKAFNLFGFIVSEIDLQGVYEKLAEEIRLICAQRPIMTRKARELIRLVNERFDTTGDSETDRSVRLYINAIYAPSEGARNNASLKDYEHFLSESSVATLEREARAMGDHMNATGLVSGYHSVLLKKLVADYEDLVPVCLHLNDRGVAEWEKFHGLISTLINETVSPDNCQCIYGLARMLGKSLFSRRPVRVGLENLRKVKIHSMVEKRISKSLINKDADVTVLQYLIGGTIKVLGQHLGVGQGNNPTCQSARGISMWSQHAPAMLIDMIITVAAQNDLVMRFDNQDLTSNQLGKGLLDNLDHNLDVVSVVLVPHLDKIYNEMMRRSSFRGEDPHKWVNPAMYGQWVHVGFASCYDYPSNSIVDYAGFVKIFYAAFHPDFNGQHQMVYPNPVGIFLTTNKGVMVGLHAISLLRVDKNKKGEMRAYFLNPNNEGRQDWGQGIKPTVFGNGEKPGESSLPFYQFVARVYAFHYSALDVKSWLSLVPQEEISKVEPLAKESWGKSYVWNQQTKLW
ncbi:MULTISPECIES: hypothetical protein [unclassified Imperialibacter]|uniref:hypothetical protein n=1 Tax=unclassified Imperialibacter TaxID=2629706 RepID=UPI001250EAAC|nr:MULTISPECIES: hypothetical protein [unclassified Imperialibacter]CAD5258108.1 conserved hypothetical protein [Imperialibacter sp. 89]CAD5273169.1 conserved hypothetical protein [Imperialibacter sp. 75]VVT32650.1 conserved hypothetical protein [Imperialibacter sp. EC-SDR9]